MDGWRRQLQVGSWSVLAACAAVGVGCAPPSRQAAGAGQALYVANAADDTITVLDGESGRLLLPAIRAGRAPGQLVVGSGGALLQLSVVDGHRGDVTWLHRMGTGHSGWVAQPLRLDPPAQQVLAAAGSADVAAVVYLPIDTAPGTPGGPAREAGWCRMALVDVAGGAVRATLPLCARGELVSSLALGSGPSGTIAYVGLMYAGSQGLDEQRIVAVDAASGAVLATRHLAAPPAYLALEPRVEAPGEWLYAVEPAGFAGAGFEAPAWAHLLALDPLTLVVERDYTLPHMTWSLTVSPDGTTAYSLGPDGGSLWRTDLRAGASAQVLELPGYGLDIAVAEGRVYVANPKGSDVWAIDRSAGRLAGSIPTGRHPVALALGPRP